MSVVQMLAPPAGLSGYARIASARVLNYLCCIVCHCEAEWLAYAGVHNLGLPLSVGGP